MGAEPGTGHDPDGERQREEPVDVAERRVRDHPGDGQHADTRQRHKQRRILAAFGTFDFDPTYDYKAERRRKRV